MGVVAPLNVFNCVQKTLGGTSKCLGCVCDIVKSVIPFVPCNSGDITIDAAGKITSEGGIDNLSKSGRKVPLSQEIFSGSGNNHGVDCGSCNSKVLSALEECLLTVTAPLNAFNCVQKTLGGTSECLGCVCDIVKTVVPLVPCFSGDITINADGEIKGDIDGAIAINPGNSETECNSVCEIRSALGECIITFVTPLNIFNCVQKTLGGTSEFLGDVCFVVKTVTPLVPCSDGEITIDASGKIEGSAEFDNKVDIQFGTSGGIDCGSCSSEVLSAVDNCLLTVVAPLNVFNCVQKTLGGTAECLSCVCDIVKTVIPLVPCSSGEKTINATGDITGLLTVEPGLSAIQAWNIGDLDCGSCVTDVRDALSNCLLTVVAPLNVFNCVQKTLGGTAQCLGCVCDIVKTALPFVPCRSGEVTINAAGEINGEVDAGAVGEMENKTANADWLKLYCLSNTCESKVHSAVKNCLLTVLAPLNVFNCAQKTLGGATECLRCVCDSVKTVIPLVPCKREEISIDASGELNGDF